jgi:hypothetical protein
VLCVLGIYCQSFTLIDGTQLSLHEIKNSKKERIVFIFQSGLSCHDCYATLAYQISLLQKKCPCKVFIISGYKENVFQRKMVSLDIKRKLRIDLDETYIFDEDGNDFIKKYQVAYSPSILYIRGKGEFFLPYFSLFRETGFNQELFDKTVN